MRVTSRRIPVKVGRARFGLVRARARRWPAPAARTIGCSIAAIGGSPPGSAHGSVNQSAPVALPRSAFTAPRRVFSSTRRTREAFVGRVARRRFGRACAFTSKSVSRARASSRLRGWLAKLWAKMTIDAVLRGARSCELDEPDRDVVRQTGRAAGVEPKLDRARHLVDVLPARTRGAHETLDDLALVNDKIAGFHGPTATPSHPQTDPRSQPLPPSRATRDACGPGSPGGLRNCGSRSKRSARPG